MDNKSTKEELVREEMDGTSPFLGPIIWDKTLSDLKLEYMDLDNFLEENCVPTVESLRLKSKENRDSTTPITTKRNIESPVLSNTSVESYSQDGENRCTAVVSPKSSETDCVSSSSASEFEPATETSFKTVNKKRKSDLNCNNNNINDDNNNNNNNKASQNETDYETDVNFDPINRTFSEEDLKVQPMIKKSQKQFVPEDLKDDKYWARRRKNNIAAKRSREARRVKENQIVLRASYLEKENNLLKEEVTKLRENNIQLQKRLEKYEF